MTLRTFIFDRESLPITETLAWLRQRIRQAAPDSPARATYTLMLQTLTYLAHERDLLSFPSDKVLRLFERARLEAGWTRKRKRLPKPTDIPLHHKCCDGCGEVKPNKKFHRLATTAERERYGWTGTRRTVTDNYCQACRIKRTSRLRQRARQRLFSDSPHARMRHILLAKLETARRLRRSAAHKFYALRTECLKLALHEVERRVDGGVSLGQEVLEDWTLLLMEQDRKRLFDAYQEVLSQHLPGRTPTI